VGGPDAEATLRKALAIGADEAIRINAAPTDGLFVAKQLANIVKEGGYDLVIAGKESLDYNGGMVPGMLAGILGYNFVNACVGIDLNGTEAKVTREIDGGKEIILAGLPLIVGGQKGIVEEKDLRIPNMRGIMMARSKVLTIVEPTGDTAATQSIKFEKPAAKTAVKLVNADNLDDLINLLHNEAKVI
jgi:electron transfer flavoprotein beta subunit